MGNPREMFSSEKIDFGYQPEQGADDFLRERLDSLITALSKKNTPKPKAEIKPLEVTALPEDIYQKRKDLAALLTLKTLAPDELTTVARGNRQVTMDIINNIDDALNKSSNGKFSDYLSAHSQQMEPITEGRAIQDIIDKFVNKPKVPFTDIPEMTPYALKKAVHDKTFFNSGKMGLKSNVSDPVRAKLNDAIDVLESINMAKKGVVPLIGSPTTPFATSLAQDTLSSEAARAGGLPGRLAMAIHGLGMTRGQNALDDALLNPENLQPILDKFHSLPDNASKKRLTDAFIRALQIPTAATINE